MNLCVKNFILKSKIQTIYNQFYAIKDLSFLQSYSTSLNFILAHISSQLNSGNFRTTSNDPIAITKSVNYLSPILAKITQLSFKLNLQNLLFENPDTAIFYSKFKKNDNCVLIENLPIFCDSKFVKLMFKNGLNGYVYWLLTVYKQLVPEFTGLASGMPNFNGSNKSKLFFQFFGSLKSVVFQLVK